MNNLTLFYNLIIKSASMFFVVLILAYYFKGKSLSFSNKLKIFLIFLITIITCFLYLYKINFLLTILIVIIPYIILYNNLLFVVVLLLGYIFINLIFLGFNYIYLFYLLMIFLSYFILKIPKNGITKHIVVFFLGLLFLNVELLWFGYKSDEILIVNILSIFKWLTLLLVIYYFKKYHVLFISFKKTSTIDYFTGINNYLSLQENAKRLLQKKYNLVSLLLINVDYLKNINRIYGNDAGNEMINTIIDKIKELIKDYGQLYRIDSDTFCVLLTNNSPDLLFSFSERIRSEIEINEVIFDNNKIKTTVSIGGFYGVLKSKNINEYIELAQESLNYSKFKGKNNVTFYHDLV